MAKKEKKVGKADEKAEDKAPRWTVRGVPASLQKAAGDVARMRGQTLGQWLSEVVAAAVDGAPERPADQGWREALENRIARLEVAMNGGPTVIITDSGNPAHR